LGTIRGDEGGAVVETAGAGSGASLDTNQMRLAIATMTAPARATAPRFIREKS
jgi:hypothetical protein